MKTYMGCLALFTASLFAGLAAGCGDHDRHHPVAVWASALPTVSFVNPANLATDVPINRQVAATFSEPMDPLTVTGVTFTLKGPGVTPVAGAVTYVGTTATFTPTSSLAASTLFTATITSGAKDLTGNALAGNKVWTFTTGVAADATAPTVSSTVPANAATGVALNMSPAATFSEAMDPLTLTTTTFTLEEGGLPVAGAVSYVGSTATFTPTIALAASTLFTATVTTGAKDLAGNALAGNFVWTFTTGAAADVTAPTVSSTIPANAATGVAPNMKPTATFSEAMDPLSITNVTFTMAGPGATSVAGTVTYAGLTATFTPDIALSASTLYTATISTGVADLAGNALASNKVWTFTTGAAADVTAPTVSSTIPANLATGVALNMKPSALFSEAMDPLTITNITFTMTGPGVTPVAGTVTYVGSTATFNPSSALLASTLFTATISTGVKDLAGNALASNKVWTFTTGVAPDVTAPTVSSTIPANLATGVALNMKPTALFSEAMDPLTITNLTFTMTGPGVTPVAGAVTYAGSTATFSPDTALTASTLYTATISTGVKDLAGNAMAASKVWSFTTGAAPDTTPPVVSSTIPANAAVGVALNIKPTALFSEVMDPLTITNVTFTMTGPGVTPVAGAVTYAGSTATFSPDAALAATTVYTATISTGVKDLAGNAMAADKVWSFTTGAAPDVLAPTVTSTNPADAAVGVTINKSVNATFSEAMDPLTITTDTIALMTGATPVVGTVAYDALTMIATFDPTDNFGGNTVYTATIKSGIAGAKDLAGNALAADKVWTFTTGTATAAAPIVLGAAAPFGGFGGNAGMTNEGIFTVINGDITTTAASTLITGFHDTGGNVYTETGSNIGTVNGTIYTATAPPGSEPGVIAAACAGDAQTAFDNMSPAALPGGIDVSTLGGGPGDLGSRTLAPGIYQSAPGTFAIQGGDLTLDAGGDANAVWVFQMASSLTVGGPGAAFPQSVLLINGAQAKNVFWQVGSAATINEGGGGTMVGTIIAAAGVTFSTSGNVTLVTLDGRALGLNASVTMVNTVVNVPAP